MRDVTNNGLRAAVADVEVIGVVRLVASRARPRLWSLLSGPLMDHKLSHSVESHRMASPCPVLTVTASLR